MRASLLLVAVAACGSSSRGPAPIQGREPSAARLIAARCELDGDEAIWAAYDRAEGGPGNPYPPPMVCPVVRPPSAPGLIVLPFYEPPWDCYGQVVFVDGCKVMVADEALRELGFADRTPAEQAELARAWALEVVAAGRARPDRVVVGRRAGALVVTVETVDGIWESDDTATRSTTLVFAADGSYQVEATDEVSGE